LPDGTEVSLDVDPANVFTFSGRLRSVRCAVTGLKVLVSSQHNAWVHATATGLVLAAGSHYRLAVSEWCWMIAAISAVWAGEAINTAFELLADVASPGFDPLVGKAKDVAAASVLITASGAALIGAVILGPYLIVELGGSF
jgi:diacylglycerol kinase (ATP)